MSSVPRATIEAYPAGTRPLKPPFPGDFILTHGIGWVSEAIRWGQGLRFRGADHHHCHWNHAALVAGYDGTLIEALGGGVTRTNLSYYVNSDYHLVRVDMTPPDRAEAAAFAAGRVGDRYGWWTMASLALTCLTGGKFSFEVSGTYICSGLVACAQERGNAVFEDAEHTMPAGLSKAYGVPPWQKPSSP